MHADADIVVRCCRRFTGVEAHPNAQRALIRPQVIRQRTLRIDRRAECVVCAAERDEHRIAGATEIVSCVLGACLADQRAMLFQQLTVALRPDFRQTPRRVFDVAEKESDRAGERHGVEASESNLEGEA